MTDNAVFAPTPGQTVGPFFGYALPVDHGNEVAARSHPAAIRLSGRVFDGEGVPIPDALVEIWQADENGEIPQVAGSLHRDGWTFTGWGRAATDNSGTYSFTTVRPGASPAGAAPFFAVTVVARGLLNRLFTRAYLPVDEATISADRFLSALPAERMKTLIAIPDGRDLRFDIRLQGVDETVFVRYPGDHL